MKYVWEDLPKPLNCFTVRGTTMVNLNTGKIVSNYAANTKIVVVQKCVAPSGTYYRTREAAHHYLNYAFRASAFGLPDEKAPSVPSSKKKPNSLSRQSTISKPASRTQKPAKKQKSVKKAVTPKDGEGKRHRLGWIGKLFGRRNG